MGNDADRYRRFLNGDDNGLREIIDMSLFTALCTAADLSNRSRYWLTARSNCSERHNRLTYVLGRSYLVLSFLLLFSCPFLSPLLTLRTQIPCWIFAAC